MKDYYLPSFFAAMPEEWQNIISLCTKYTQNDNESVPGVGASQDKFFLPSEYEIYGDNEHGTPKEADYQQQYTYYQTAANRIRYSTADTSAPVEWWTRTKQYGAAQSNILAFVAVNTDGTKLASYANAKYAVAPHFMIA